MYADTKLLNFRQRPKYDNRKYIYRLVGEVSKQVCCSNENPKLGDIVGAWFKK